jgi:hypothetical protein
VERLEGIRSSRREARYARDVYAVDTSGMRHGWDQGRWCSPVNTGAGRRPLAGIGGGRRPPSSLVTPSWRGGRWRRWGRDGGDGVMSCVRVGGRQTVRSNRVHGSGGGPPRVASPGGGGGGTERESPSGETCRLSGGGNRRQCRERHTDDPHRSFLRRSTSTSWGPARGVDGGRGSGRVTGSGVYGGEDLQPLVLSFWRSRFGSSAEFATKQNSLEEVPQPAQGAGFGLEGGGCTCGLCLCRRLAFRREFASDTRCRPAPTMVFDLVPRTNAPRR